MIFTDIKSFLFLPRNRWEAGRIVKLYEEEKFLSIFHDVKDKGASLPTILCGSNMGDDERC